MKDYCTLRPLVVRVQARMYIFWKFDILGFLGNRWEDVWGTAGRMPGEPSRAAFGTCPLSNCIRTL